MILLALALQATGPATAVEAERAFAADAQAIGQWSAFRKWAAEDAVMFAPQPTAVRALLADAKDPPESIRWSPGASFVSCDGLTAANTGPWTRPDGGVGYFSTVWVKGATGWRWKVDGGDPLTTPRPAVVEPPVRRAACGTSRPAPFAMPAEGQSGIGRARDGTLAWTWTVQADGARRFRVALWTDKGWEMVIDDRIAAPTPEKPRP